MQEHIMLDIETLGVGPNACIIAIGACTFTKDRLLDNHIYLLPIWEGEMDYSTIEWWFKQTDEARLEVTLKAKVPLYKALVDLVDYIGDKPVWGNGVDFDNLIVTNACKRLGVKNWSYKQNRCFRTIKNVFAPMTYNKPVIPHHAAYDAVAQAETLIKIAKDFNIPL